MTLATVDAAGEPDARTGLLNEFDRDGPYIHTDSSSRKAAQFKADPPSEEADWAYARRVPAQPCSASLKSATRIRACAPHTRSTTWEMSTSVAALR